MQHVQMQQQPQQESQQFYTSAPVSEAVSTAAMPSAHSTPTITNRTPPHTMSPHGGMPTSQPTTSDPRQTMMMNHNAGNVQRPSLPHQQSSASSAHSNQQTQQQPTPQKPTDPAAAAQPTPESKQRDKDRIELVMKINQALLLAATKLQAEGRGTDLEPIKGQMNLAPEKAQDFVGCALLQTILSLY
jgi:hypothetical protein